MALAAIVLVAVPQDTAAALDAALSNSERKVVATHRWSPDAGPRDVALIVATADDPVATAVALRRSTAAPLLILCRNADVGSPAALDAGADACLDRKASNALVVAQAQALLRRATQPAEPVSRISAGLLVIDTTSHVVHAGSDEIRLSPREFDLLVFFAKRLGRAVRREELLAAVWGPRYVGATNTVDVHVAWLRQKIPDGSGVRITTLRGVGYRFDALNATDSDSSGPGRP